MKYFTDDMKKQIRELILKYSDLDNVKMEKNWGDKLECVSIKMPLKFPYEIEIGTSSEHYKNQLWFYRTGVNKNKQDEVTYLFIELTNKIKLSKADYKKLVDLIDLEQPISKTDTNFLNLLVYDQSFEKSSLKKYTGQPFGSKDLKQFLKENKQFYIVRNWVSQSKRPMALTNENDDYIKLAYTDYIKLFSELEDCEVVKQPDDLLL